MFSFGWNSDTHSGDEKQIIETEGLMWTNLYKVYIDEISVDDVAASSGGEAFLDCGTTETYFPPSVYDKIVSQIGSFCAKQSSNCAGNNSFEHCYSKGLFDTTADEEVAKTFPVLKFRFK